MEWASEISEVLMADVHTSSCGGCWYGDSVLLEFLSGDGVALWERKRQISALSEETSPFSDVSLKESVIFLVLEHPLVIAQHNIQVNLSSTETNWVLDKSYSHLPTASI